MRSLAVTSGIALVLAACSGDDTTTDNPAPVPTTSEDGGSPPKTPDAGVRPLGPPQPSGGVLLEADGTIIPFGGVKLDTSSAASWPGKDIARSLVVLSDGSGGWVLDGLGPIHAFGTAPKITSPIGGADDVARALVVLSDQQSGYVLDRDGGVHPFGKAPTIASSWTGKDQARGLEVHTTNGAVDGGWVLDGFGGMHAFGAATDLGAPPQYKDYDVWTKLHVVEGGAYVIGRWGLIQPLGKPAGIPLTGLPDTKDADIVRDIVPVSAKGAFDPSRELICPTNGGYCGSDGIRGGTNVLYTCPAKDVAPSVTICGKGCSVQPMGISDFCVGSLSCGNEQWWNTALTYGPYMSYGWWDTDLAVAHDTPVIVRHDSKLYKTGVYGWGYMPEFVDQVTGLKFRFLHLRPQKQLATNVGQVYPAGTVVGYSGGDTADTGLGQYSTGSHLCVQTLDAYRTVFPAGKDPCQ